MAVTQTEAAKFTTNSVKRGVLETIVKDSVVLQQLPFVDVVGNAWQYLQENSLATADFYDPNEVWQEDTGDFTQKTAVLRIMGGDADVDNFLKATRSDKTDFAAEVIDGKAKAVKHAFLTNFYYGSNSTNSKQFDGLQVLLAAASSRVVHQGSGTTGAALTVTNLETAIDKIRDGAADVLLMPRAARTRLNRYIRSTGSGYLISPDKYGNQVHTFNELPIHIDDFLLETETISSGAYATSTTGATHSVFVVRFGSQDLIGLQSGGLSTKALGQLENKDAMRWRIKWYCSLALMRDLGCAEVDGITTAAVTA